MKMRNRYYRRVNIVHGSTTEPVEFVGIHPLLWKDVPHPEIPDAGFVEEDVTSDIVNMILDFKEEAQNYLTKALEDKDTGRELRFIGEIRACGLLINKICKKYPYNASKK